MSAQTQNTKPGPRMLSAVTKGKIAKPIRALLYGVEGVGKSTFGANAPSPIVLGTESGTAELDVARFADPDSWADVMAAVDELRTEAHDYKTLVIDTLDWLEPLCWARVCERPDEKGKRRESIEDFGYGKGYTAALDEWRLLLARLEQLRAARGMNVIMLAHSWIKPFKNPEGDDFDRYELKLHAKAGGLLKEWCDAVLFAHYETLTDKDRNKRVRGISTGARLIHTTRTAAWDAKNRYDLPDTMPLDWSAFADAVVAHRPADPAAIRDSIAEMLTDANAELAAKVRAAVNKDPENAAYLARIQNKLQATIGEAA